MTGLEAIILGIVEGLSEFLPISSTGHLILASTLMKITQTDFHKVFEVTIQLGAMLAVLYLYRKQLVTRSGLYLKLAVAFLPTGIFGFTLYKFVKSMFQPSVVSYMLIAGGIAFLVVEWYLRDHRPDVPNIEALTYKQAFLIGLVQSLSMVPGVSRSGATILGGLFVGMDRKNAAEFSFLLALPTMFAATSYDIYKNIAVFHKAEWDTIAIGFATSFIFGVISIKWLVKFISHHTFVPFGIYRIIAGVLFLLLVP
ncbi:undecaprenyl-diphosphate phosphatase [Geomonas sp. RF6]|uniref:undecaprenyl-diphosphate phosphatase n=1 Tax=Geomonas sp. RF6 TaxID=2897342 RepID=UPI001E40285A|nr:undecaprenyl-diphosphate phosphatase [Geomonas sp. RF6]UFS72381.1 undecaprenyl-diphosphate phosphatase [Geomonas sp. RF6]